MKDADGKWDLRAHAGRIITVDNHVLRSWNDILEEGQVPVEQSRMVYTCRQPIRRESVLEKIADAPRIGGKRLHIIGAEWTSQLTVLKVISIRCGASLHHGTTIACKAPFTSPPRYISHPTPRC